MRVDNRRRAQRPSKLQFVVSARDRRAFAAIPTDVHTYKPSAKNLSFKTFLLKAKGIAPDVEKLLKRLASRNEDRTIYNLLSCLIDDYAEDFKQGSAAPGVADFFVKVDALETYLSYTWQKWTPIASFPKLKEWKQHLDDTACWSWADQDLEDLESVFRRFIGEEAWMVEGRHDRSKKVPKMFYTLKCARPYYKKYPINGQTATVQEDDF
ncbi:hypothetical protein N0V90_005218 [Kalmusia sp. IMI 367209]|nr:hypothetical protein N0V90_005218 [Kalmusia sp. IMI 367209]